MAHLFNNLLLLIADVGGLSAIWIYLHGRKSERRNAARRVVMDIRRAENIIEEIRKNSHYVNSQKIILTENNWEKFSHLLARKLTYDEIAAFNRFFDYCLEIDEAKKRIEALFDQNLFAKAAVTQEMVLNVKDPFSQTGIEEKVKITENANKENWVFDASTPNIKIQQAAKLIGQLSGTPSFNKLLNLI